MQPISLRLPPIPAPDFRPAVWLSLRLTSSYREVEELRPSAASKSPTRLSAGGWPCSDQLRSQRALVAAPGRFTFRSNHQESQNARDTSELISKSAPT